MNHILKKFLILLDEKSSLCMTHLREFEKRKERNLKRRKKRKLVQQQKLQQQKQRQCMYHLLFL